MTAEWLALNPDQKKQYVEMQGREKEKYEGLMREYKKKQSNSNENQEKEKTILKKRPASSPAAK